MTEEKKPRDVPRTFEHEIEVTLLTHEMRETRKLLRKNTRDMVDGFSKLKLHKAHRAKEPGK